MTFASLFASRHASLLKTQRGVTKPRALRALLGLGVASYVGTLGLLPLQAQAKALPNISASCFTYSPGQVKTGPHSFVSTDFRAELPGTGLSLRVASSHITDHANHLDAAGLERINAAAAYAALSASHHGLSDACRTMPIPETDEVKNATPEAFWSMTTLSQKGRTDITAQNIHLSVLSTSPGIHAIFSATGLPTDHPLLPSRVSGDLTFYPAPTPPYHIALNSMKSTIGKSEIEGHGTVNVAPTISDLKGSLHLSISHIGSLIEKVGSVAPAKVTTALMVARLMSIHEGDHLSGWNITIDNGQAKINGISVPLPNK